MTGLIHRRVGLAVWKAAGLGDEKRFIASLKAEEWSVLARTFKRWRFTELENTGWKNAQTTGGGIALHQLEPDTFQLRSHPNVYIVGETTDCAGSCGGFNLHWAFGSGILAGEAAARQLGGTTATRPPAKPSKTVKEHKSAPRKVGKPAKTAPGRNNRRPGGKPAKRK